VGARLLVLSDTHIPDFAKQLPSQVREAARGVDAILHAGDVTSAEVLDDLSASAPVYVALGNGDGPDVQRWGAADRVETEIAGASIAIVHDAGPARGRPARLRRWFPDSSLVVFGHSHIPMSFVHEGVRMLNPGSATWKRRQPAPTFAKIAIGARGTRVRLHEIP
jgi:uncharacterized protein